MDLYEVKILRQTSLVRWTVLETLVVRARNPLEAKRVAVDVANEQWPRTVGHAAVGTPFSRSRVGYSKLSGERVTLEVQRLEDPEVSGWCYPVAGALKTYSYTFR